MGEERMGLDHQVRYYTEPWEVDRTWDVWQDNGSLTFPTHICNCDTLEQAKLIRDALESFPKELEQYITTPEQTMEDYL